MARSGTDVFDLWGSSTDPNMRNGANGGAIPRQGPTDDGGFTAGTERESSGWSNWDRLAGTLG